MSESFRTRSAVLRWIPRILLFLAIAFSAFLGWYLSKGQGNSQTDPEAFDDDAKKVIQKQEQIEYSHFDQGRLVYHVTADHVEMLKSQQQQLENPEFIFYDNNQKEMVRVTGKHCNISKDFNQITVIEDSRVVSESGMQVLAHMIKYDSHQETFSTPGAANFKWKTLRGKSKGFVYNIPQDQLDLLEKPEITYLKKEEDGKKPIVMTGDTGMIDRKNGFAYFEGQVEVTQEKNRIRAHRLEATFVPGTNDLEQLTAIKNVKIKFIRSGKEAQQAAATPAGPVAAPGPAVQTPGMSNVFSADASSDKELEAEYAELFFYDDGQNIRAFHSTGDCTFILHTFDKNNKPQENRIIKGQNFEAQFNLMGDMTEFHATKDVSVKLQPIGNPKKQEIAARQTVYCDDLIAHFVPETGDVKEIHFKENFRHVQGARTVSSKSAIYNGATRKTDLIGEPEIDDASFNITAQSMELFEETSGIHAKGDVKSAFVKSDGKTPSTFPFSSPSGQPVYISSEDMQWDSQKSEATYTDKAKLWQEKNVITAARIIINDKDKTLSAYDKVHTIFYNNKKQQPAPAPDKKTAQTQTQTQSQPADGESGGSAEKLFAGDSSESGPISVDAGIMNYAEKDRIIHFEKDVKITTQATKINSSKADFFLKEETSELDRLYSQGKVTIVHEAKRGSGDFATFYAQDGRLVLEGNPKLQETGKADILGRVLTLFLSDDRILIDGQEDGRATTTLNMKAGYTPSRSGKEDAKKSDSKSKASPEKPEPD